MKTASPHQDDSSFLVPHSEPSCESQHHVCIFSCGGDCSEEGDSVEPAGLLAPKMLGLGLSSLYMASGTLRFFLQSKATWIY